MIHPLDFRRRKWYNDFNGAVKRKSKGEIKMNNFSEGQIVSGIKCGTFVILGFRFIEGEVYAQLKAVNPKNHNEMARGELALPITAIKAI